MKFKQISIPKNSPTLDGQEIKNQDGDLLMNILDENVGVSNRVTKPPALKSPD